MATKGATERKEIEMKQPVSIDFSHAFEVFDEVWQRIANRAYKLFDGRGRQDGHALDDWLSAERELFSPVPIEIAETDNQLIVRAEVPGFDREDLKVYVEPEGLVIKGESEKAKEEKTERTVYSERRAKEIYRSLDLPAEVDTSTASASLSNGMLEVTLTKTENAEPSGTEVKIK